VLRDCGDQYYFFPLTEQRPRLYVTRHGLFVDGFGLIAWNAIGEITLIAWRLLMRLSWTSSPGNTLRIDLQPFSTPAAEIRQTLQRPWRMRSGSHDIDR
jgi:hypothetical protein